MSPDQQLALGALALNTKIAVLLAAAKAKRQASAVAVPLASAGPTLHAEQAADVGWGQPTVSAPSPATTNKLMLAGGALAAAVGAWFLLR